MGKKGTLKWKPVALNEAILSKGNIEGLLGIEELSDYALKKSSKFGGEVLTVKTKQAKKKTNRKKIKGKLSSENRPKSKRKTIEKSSAVETVKAPLKKRKYSEHSIEKNPKKKRKVVHDNSRKTEASPCDDADKQDEESIDERKLMTAMASWNGLFVPIPILRALFELGFDAPTQIQALSLPAAIKGRKDMMGAAETGSGKTLAFGIPILTGIMKAKEMAETKEKEENISSDEEEETEEASHVDDEILEVESVSDCDEDIRKRDTVTSDEEANEEADEAKSESDKIISDFEEADEDQSESEEADKDTSGFEEADEDQSGSEEVDEEVEMLEVTQPDEKEDNMMNENIENELTCVRVIDNVKFPFSVIEGKKPKTTNKLWALILTPTRELAIQVYKHLLAIAKYSGIKIAVIVGGMAPQKQERMLRRCPEVVVATPGRLWELIEDGNQHLSGVDKIRFLAVDEADRMMQVGHFKELKNLLERINKGGKASRQNFVYSATLSLVHEGAKRNKNKFKRRQTPGQKLHSLAEMIGLKNPKIVDVTPEGATCGGLVETRLMSSSMLDRDIRLVSLLTYLSHSPFSGDSSSTSKTIVFCNSVGGVRRLSGLLTALQLSPFTLHAGMQQRQRLRSLEKFSKGGILIATDVAARGLDLPLVDHVIHFQVPRVSETYVHRSGRTARAQREGLSVLLVEPKEVPSYNRLCRTLGKDDGLPLFPIDEQLVKMVKQRVNLAREIDFLEHQLRRSNAEGSWLNKTMEEAEIMVDEDYIPKKYNVDNSKFKKELNVKKKELNALLSKILLPFGFSPRYPTMNGGLETPKVGVGDNAVQVVKSRLQEKHKNKRVRKSKHRKKT